MTAAEREVLAANDAFYTAFARRDAQAMETLWAHQAPVACLHPGWEPLVGREAVVESWRRILLGGGAPPSIRCDSAEARVSGDFAWVICREVLPGGALAATNLFIREAGAWRLVHHHASPLPAPPPRPSGLAN
ncbi:MAG TPA: nuclear transport factor 2 family protein [Myxococcales bacterium]|nr:nuclear transport factor 2 family protein [Myxococcales bacterium]